MVLLIIRGTTIKNLFVWFQNDLNLTILQLLFYRLWNFGETNVKNYNDLVGISSYSQMCVSGDIV